MILYIAGGLLLIFATMLAFSWYTVVDPSEAHLVVTPKSRFVVSSDEELGDRTAYFAIPSFIPFFGRQIRILDVTIRELICTQETYEKDQARYQVRSSLKYRIVEVIKAAETFTNRDELNAQLKEIVQASVRAVTVKYDVVDARAKKKEIGDKITQEIQEDLGEWGIKMINFQLVDFQDTEDSTIISDISKRREVEINSETRELNAEKFKQARVKEAESDEVAQKREIQRDEEVSKRNEQKDQRVSQERKKSEEERLKVVKVTEVQQAEIDRQKAVVRANEQKDVEEIRKFQKQLEGEGDKLREEQRAIGDAAIIREKGLAEAEAKDKLQEALNKFEEAAIRALVAEQVVRKDENVGKALAQALQYADLRVFAGDGDGQGQAGFNLGSLIESISVSNAGAADATMNRLARPNDLGLALLQKWTQDADREVKQPDGPREDLTEIGEEEERRTRSDKYENKTEKETLDTSIKDIKEQKSAAKQALADKKEALENAKKESSDNAKDEE